MKPTPPTLLEELATIDAALLDDDATDQQEKRGQELVALANAAPGLLEAAILAEDVLSEIARLDDGTPSISALGLLRAAIAKVKGEVP